MLLAPIPRPSKNIFCVGKNYHEHAKEFAGSGFDASTKDVVPEAPVVFTKPPTSVSGPGDAIPSFLDPTGSTDYEGELAVVIGKGGRGIAKADWAQHVFGYTIVNDVTARTLQHKHRQWVLGKGIDGFCPMGPAILTADEAPDPTKLRLTTHVNGEKRQDALVADLIFDIPTLIEAISGRHHPRARRHHRHRHAGRRRHRLQAAALPQARRRGADRGGRDRRAGEYRGMRRRALLAGALAAPAVPRPRNFPAARSPWWSPSRPAARPTWWPGRWPPGSSASGASRCRW